MDYKNKTFVIGDLILDEYIVGKEYRISDEAPVPIVKVDSFLTQLGGAANVANNLKKLGSDVILCGAIGDPSSGYSAIRFLEEMRKNDLITFCISEQPMKTTTKSRVIIKNQQVVRFDYEDNFIPKSAHEEIIEKIKIIDFRTISLIVVSDYSKGVINKEIIDLLKRTGVKIIVDPKPSNLMLYNDVFAITPNLREFNEMIGEQIDCHDGRLKDAAKEFISLHNIEVLVITLGKDGALYCTRKECDIVPAHQIEVCNPIGAGDTFVAAFVYALSENKNIRHCVEMGNTAASIVVTKRYTGTCTLQEIDNFCERQ